MSNFARIKNVSKGQLILDFGAVTPGKEVLVKPDTILTISHAEYEYLTTSCKKMFEFGDIDTIDADGLEIAKAENVYFDEDIDKIVALTAGKFKTAIDKIENLDALKMIRQKSMDEGKTKKFLEVIDERIKALNGDVVLI